MLFSVSIKDFYLDYIHFSKSKKNIIMNGLFNKILYSDSEIVFNGLYLNFVAYVQNIQNKIFFVLTPKFNTEWIQKCIHVENDILLYYKKTTHQNHLKSMFLLKNQLEKGILKYCPVDNPKNMDIFLNKAQTPFKMVLKISGLWQNQNNIGLNYKIVQAISLEETKE